MFLDADDVLRPLALELLIEALRRDSGAMIAFGQAAYIGENSQPLDPSTLPDTFSKRYAYFEGRVEQAPWDAPTDYDILVYQNCIRTPGVVLIPRRSLESVGLFDLDAYGFEDWDLWLRMSLRGRITAVQDVVLDYRVHADNMSKRTDPMMRGELRVRQKLALSSELTQDQRDMAAAAFDYWYLRHLQLEMLTDTQWIVNFAVSGQAPDAALPADFKDKFRAAVRGVFLDTVFVETPELATKLKAISQTGEKSEAFSVQDLLVLRARLVELRRDELRSRIGHAANGLVHGKFVDALRNGYHALLCIKKLATPGKAV
jgi:hypothetical protein